MQNLIVLLYKGLRRLKYSILSPFQHLITSFLLIIISGEHLGGFYALYLLLALFYGGIHSLLGLSGIVLLIIAVRLIG